MVLLFGAIHTLPADTVSMVSGDAVGSDHKGTGVPPNILLLLADDLGFNDSTLFNTQSDARTPALRDLADGSFVFSRHYADATCVPSRVALLTGRYAERLGFRPNGLEIPPELVTLPEALQQLGYRTHLVGKWHAGEVRPESLPLAQGFHTFFGFHNQWSLSGSLDSTQQKRQRPTYLDPWLREGRGPLQRFEGHLTDLLAERSLQLIRESREDPSPWFLMHAFFAPHAPLQPAARFTASGPQTPESKHLALIEQLDEVVGRLMAALTESGQANTTVVVFLSDNGGTNHERDNNFPWFGSKGETHEGSLRTPLVLRWPEQIDRAREISWPVMNTDLYPTLLAMAGAPAIDHLDGLDLTPFLTQEAPARAARSWEQYVDAVDATAFGYLTGDGRWRLTSLLGRPAALYDLQSQAVGDQDVAARHKLLHSQLLGDFREHAWEKSVLPVREQRDREGGTRHYTGWDMTRTPYRYGFAIGLEIPPHEAPAPGYGYAEQEGVWSLTQQAHRELNLKVGVLEASAPALDHSVCNDVIVTGHFQPPARYMASEARQRVKLYVNGQLVAQVREPAFKPPHLAAASNPTVVRGSGRAVFSNLLLSSSQDPYEPDVPAEHEILFRELMARDALMRMDIAPMRAQLCSTHP
ncbi:MAG: sulfatase-like hydrolase/transferase [Pseudomonadota bacterium]